MSNFILQSTLIFISNELLNKKNTPGRQTAAEEQLSHFKTPVNTGVYGAETVGFEPTCRLPDNLISSQARYDHFDTSPNIKFTRHSLYYELPLSSTDFLAFFRILNSLKNSDSIWLHSSARIPRMTSTW